MQTTARGQSEVVSNILLIAVVVVVTTTASVGVIAAFSDTTETTLFDPSVTVTNDRIEICHGGGDTLEVADVGLSIDGESMTLAETRAVGEPRSTFRPGDCRVVGHDESDNVEIAFDTDRELLGETTQSVPAAEPALRYEYYESASYTSLEDSWDDEPKRTGLADGFDISLRDRDDNFAFNFTGELYVPTDGEYTFETWSDDGSRLYIDDQRVVENGGLHANSSADGSIDLTEGTHEITVTHFEHTGQEDLQVNWEGPGFEREQLDDSYLETTSDITPRFTVDCAGLACKFNASDTTADGVIQSYEWDFGDGQTETTLAPTVSHTYSSEGEQTVALTVETRRDSKSLTRTFEVIKPEPALNPDPATVSDGVTYRYYESETGFTSLPDFSTVVPQRMDTTESVQLEKNRGSDFAFEYVGYIEVPQTDTYTFSTTSDDGSQLYVAGQKVVENGGVHPPNEESGRIALEEGNHTIRVVMFEHGGGEVIEASIESSEMSEHQLQNLTTEAIVPEFSVDCVGTECDFDATASSTGSRDTITAYDWQFDGTSANGETVTYDFGSAGTYDVNLTVTTTEGTERISKEVSVDELRQPDNPGTSSDGITYSYYEATDEFESMPDFGALIPDRNGTTTSVQLENPRENDFAFEYEGYVDVSASGMYTFYTTSDDGSRLYIGDELVVENGGRHAAREESGEIGLQSGKHEIRIEMFEHTGQETISAAISSDSMAKQEITSLTYNSALTLTGDSGISTAETNDLTAAYVVDGSGTEDKEITWSVLSGNGTLSATSTTTDSSGETTVTYTPADSDGGSVIEIEARVTETGETETATFPVAESRQQSIQFDEGMYDGTSTVRGGPTNGLGIGYVSGADAVDTTMPGYDALVGQWRLDESISGTADGEPVLDDSGNGNEGVIVNEPSTGVGGVYNGTAFSFDGDDDRIEIANQNVYDLDTFTLNVWFKTDGSSDNAIDVISSKQNGDYTKRNWWLSMNYGFGGGPDPGGLWFRTSSGNNNPDIDLEDSTDYRDGEWHMATVTVNQSSDKATLFVDGQRRDQTTGIGTPDGDGAPIYIGQGVGSPDRLWTGELDQHMVFEESLTEQDVSELYFQGQPYVGNYTSKTIDEGTTDQNWEEMNVRSDIPTGTDLTVTFRALDSNGNQVDSQTETLTGGEDRITLDVQSSPRAEVRIEGSSTEKEQTWTVTDLTVTYHEAF